MAWYQKNESEVINSLNSDAQQGLTHDEAKRRIDQYGLNELVDRGLKSPWKILWEQLTGLMVLILIVAAVISGLLGEYKDVIVIMVIVVLNALLARWILRWWRCNLWHKKRIIPLPTMTN